ncbi:MAG: alkyl hydroperoxide reductase subunit F [Betaproteobacteria bacterium]|nr:alkyl hydroperoxide reductase subunit F [Betaproteobacteria bacterium]
MLDQSIKAQLSGYLEKLQRPIELVASLDASEKAEEMRAFLGEIAALSDRVSMREDGQNRLRPSFSVALPGEAPRIHFAGLPMGHEFTSLVLALLQTGGHPVKLEESLIRQISGLPGTFRFEIFISLSCHNCPDVVQALNSMAVLNPAFEVTMIDGGAFPAEVEERRIMAVPTVFLNGEAFGQGRMSVEEIIARLDTGASERAAEEISAKAPFDVLVIGGGPAGSTAAIYEARKGIRTGMLVERFGGQVMDTLSIENFISVKKTEGPKLGAALEAHVAQYDVDVMKLQRANAIKAGAAGELITVETESGASLKTRALILATGARWREMNVPGEREYKTKGVCFCPHCDGPLFTGKRVAVIGGGNSGVEAAIDLAGIVAHVTLIEFDTQLRADAVLQEKLKGLPNVNVRLNTQTTEVIGDGEKVTALSCQDRASGETQTLEISGIFVQIGLLPSTEWLKGTLELTPRGEIVVDAKGQTSLPGVFAAGDCTNSPYKQIVIALGSGATAALSAFDYLIRMPGKG